MDETKKIRLANASSSDKSNRDDLNPTETLNESKTKTVEVSVNHIDAFSRKSASLSDEEPSNEGPANDDRHKYYQTDEEPFLIGRVKSFPLGGVRVHANETDDVLDVGTLLLLNNKRILGKIWSVMADEKPLKYFVRGLRSDPEPNDEVFCIPNDADVTFYAKDKSKRPAAVYQYDPDLDYFEGYL